MNIAKALILPLGPLFVALLRALLPYSTVDDSAATLAAATLHIGRVDAVLWLFLGATLTLVPSTLVAARLARDGAPRLSLIALVLALPAFTALPFASNDLLIRVSPDAPTLDAFNSLPQVAVATLIFIVGHLAGLIVLGVALWRSGAAPWWAGVAVIVSQPLHLIFAVIVPNALLDGLAWGLAVFGLAVAGWRFLAGTASEPGIVRAAGDSRIVRR